MTVDLNTKPRRVWLGLAVPGKKLRQLLRSHDSPWQGRGLAKLYRDDAHVGLLAAALTLHLMPRHAARHGMPYEQVLADVRDFLKFRFRAEGFVDADKRLTLDDVAKSAEEGCIVSIDVADAAVVSYVIGRLDDLAQESSGGLATRMTELLSSIRALRDLLRHIARRLGAGDEYEAMFAGPQQQT